MEVGRLLEELHDETSNLDLETGKGRVEEERIRQETKVPPNGLLEDGLLVTKGVERRFSVVRPHSRVSDTSERKLGVGYVEEGCVDSDASSTRVVNDLLGNGVVAVAKKRVYQKKRGKRKGVRGRRRRE